MTNTPNTSERWLMRYLAEHGYAGGDDPEPNLAVAKRPDFLIRRVGASAICEVKEFTTTALRDRVDAAGGGPVMLPADVTYAPVRDAIKRAAKQLKPLEGLGHPLVVVLANPHGADVELDPEDLVFALYGDPTVSFLVGPDGPVSDPAIVAGRGGRLARDHAYVSAVVTLHRRTHAQDWWERWSAEWEASRPLGDRRPLGFDQIARESFAYIAARKEAAERSQIPEGDYVFVRVIETLASTRGRAVPLPDQLFDGPRDERWRVTEDGLVCVRCAKSAIGT